MHPNNRRLAKIGKKAYASYPACFPGKTFIYSIKTGVPVSFQTNAIGQAALELLICLPILLFAALAILQIALLIYAQAVVDHASFISARAASLATLSPEEILNRYQKSAAYFKYENVQIEISTEKIPGQVPALRLNIIQGYRPHVPLVGHALVTSLANISSDNDSTLSKELTSISFKKELLQQGQIPLHTEVTLPLAFDILDYPHTIINF